MKEVEDRGQAPVAPRRLICVVIILSLFAGVVLADNWTNNEYPCLVQFTFIDEATNQPITNMTVIATPEYIPINPEFCGMFLGCNNTTLPNQSSIIGITNQNGTVNLPLYSDVTYNLTTVMVNQFNLFNVAQNYQVLV